MSLLLGPEPPATPCAAAAAGSPLGEAPSSPTGGSSASSSSASSRPVFGFQVAPQAALQRAASCGPLTESQGKLGAAIRAHEAAAAVPPALARLVIVSRPLSRGAEGARSHDSGPCPEPTADAAAALAAALQAGPAGAVQQAGPAGAAQQAGPAKAARTLCFAAPALAALRQPSALPARVALPPTDSATIAIPR